MDPKIKEMGHGFYLVTRHWIMMIDFILEIRQVKRRDKRCEIVIRLGTGGSKRFFGEEAQKIWELWL